MKAWRATVAESQRVVDEALEEAASRSGCTCCAVEVPGANHLDWRSVATGTWVP